MRFHKRTSPIIIYSAIDPGGGGGGGQPSGTPEGAPTSTPQPGGQGQGQGGGFREQFFSNVPDEVWTQVEPHVRGVQGHVTQLQQRYAPFKDYRDEDLQGLAQFNIAFNRDPVGQWLRMAQALQQNGILDEELDLEHLQAIITGNMPPEPGLPSQGGQGDEEMPPWAQTLAQKIEQLEGGVNKFQSSHRQQVEDAVLNRQISAIKADMKQAGIPDGAFSEEAILASYIAHRGNAQAAAKSFVDARNALLKGFTRTQGSGNGQPPPTGNENNDLELPHGAPKARPQRQNRGRRGGMIPANTVAAAEQFLRKQGTE